MDAIIPIVFFAEVGLVVVLILVSVNKRKKSRYSVFVFSDGGKKEAKDVKLLTYKEAVAVATELAAEYDCRSKLKASPFSKSRWIEFASSDDGKTIVYLFIRFHTGS